MLKYRSNFTNWPDRNNEREKIWIVTIQLFFPSSLSSISAMRLWWLKFFLSPLSSYFDNDIATIKFSSLSLFRLVQLGNTKIGQIFQQYARRNHFFSPLFVASFLFPLSYFFSQFW